MIEIATSSPLYSTYYPVQLLLNNEREGQSLTSVPPLHIIDYPIISIRAPIQRETTYQYYAITVHQKSTTLMLQINKLLY